MSSKEEIPMRCYTAADGSGSRFRFSFCHFKDCDFYASGRHSQYGRHFLINCKAPFHGYRIITSPVTEDLAHCSLPKKILARQG